MKIVATGFFDGVHIGHRRVISTMCRLAKERGERCGVVTFWPHPRTVLRQEAQNLRLLTSLKEKEDMFKELGVDRVIVLDFTKEFSKLSTEQFVKQYLRRRGADTLVIGYDHNIGSNPNETQEQMIATCNACGVEVVRVGEVLYKDDVVISSTKIRNLLREGDVTLAAEYLGYFYTLKGAVVTGNRLGHTMGFPTANLRLYDPLKFVPAQGVYAVIVEVEGNKHMGICNIGVRPTVGNSNTQTIETHIIDFDEYIYGLDLKIQFVQRLREEKKFPSLEFLKEQLKKDSQKASVILSSFFY